MGDEAKVKSAETLANVALTVRLAGGSGKARWMSLY
jgi:hypothetical protein